MKYLAIDYGTKHIGMAISNQKGTIAFPYKSIASDSQKLREIKKIIEERYE